MRGFSRFLFVIFVLFLFIPTLVWADPPTIAIWDVERTNERAKEYVPSAQPLIERFESSLSNTGLFKVVPSKKAREAYSNSYADRAGSVFSQSTRYANVDCLVRIHASGFSDRVELDAWVYRGSGVVVHAVKTTVNNPAGILDATERLATDLARTLGSAEQHKGLTRLYVAGFDSREEAVKTPIYVMFVTALVQTGRYAVITRESGAIRGARYVIKRLTIGDYFHSDSEHKQDISRRENIEGFVSGRIDPVGNEYQISVSMENPIRRINTGSVPTPLGLRPEDIRIASLRAARNLLKEYRDKGLAGGIIFDETLTAWPDSPATKKIALRKPSGEIIDVKVVLSMRGISKKEMGGYVALFRGEGSYAWVKLFINGVEQGRSTLSPIRSGGRRITKETPVHIDVDEYGLRLTIYDHSNYISKKMGKGLVDGLYTTSTLKSVTIKIMLKKL